MAEESGGHVSRREGGDDRLVSPSAELDRLTLTRHPRGRNKHPSSDGGPEQRMGQGTNRLGSRSGAKAGSFTCKVPEPLSHVGAVQTAARPLQRGTLGQSTSED